MTATQALGLGCLLCGVLVAVPLIAFALIRKTWIAYLDQEER